MVHIEVFGPNVWFHKGKPFLWGEDNPIPFSNTRYFKSVKTARKMARGILDNYPDAIVNICRYTNGRMKVEEWKKQGGIEHE